MSVSWVLVGALSGGGAGVGFEKDMEAGWIQARPKNLLNSSRMNP